MFRFFQKSRRSVCDYVPSDRRQRGCGRFFVEYAQPFKGLFAGRRRVVRLRAAVIEIGTLIQLHGPPVVDVLGHVRAPARVFSSPMAQS